VTGPSRHGIRRTMLRELAEDAINGLFAVSASFCVVVYAQPMVINYN
jgi:hypothetical protein